MLARGIRLADLASLKEDAPEVAADWAASSSLAREGPTGVLPVGSKKLRRSAVLGGGKKGGRDGREGRDAVGLQRFKRGSLDVEGGWVKSRLRWEVDLSGELVDYDEEAVDDEEESDEDGDGDDDGSASASLGTSVS